MGESYLVYEEKAWMRLLFSFFPALFLFIWYIAKNFPKRSHHIPFLHMISEMSYPLYLIHAIPGYIIVYILYDYGWPLGLSIPVSCALTFILSWSVHTFMEKPIRNRWSRRPPTP